MRSPARGTSWSPRIATGSPGPADFTRRPCSLNIALIRPQVSSTTTASPTRRVPVWTSTVAMGPRLRSISASTMAPTAGRSGFAFSSRISEATSIVSSRSWMPSFVLAETSTQGTSPPYSSIVTLRSASCCLTRSGLASGRSTFVIATTMGTPAARAWSIASRVWGITPSSAATTSTARSVTCAPRARMAVNASWPGVSRKVMRWLLTSTW